MKACDIIRFVSSDNQTRERRHWLHLLPGYQVNASTKYDNYSRTDAELDDEGKQTIKCQTITVEEFTSFNNEIINITQNVIMSHKM